MELYCKGGLEPSLLPEPREDAGGLSREYVLRIPACRKRRLKGRRYIAIVADTA